MIILCFIIVTAHSQTADTLKIATIQDKSETIALRMERELVLTSTQLTGLMNVLIERFQNLGRFGIDAVSLETVNRKATQMLATILTDEQYALYQELRETKKQDKEKYLKEHPCFGVLK